MAWLGFKVRNDARDREMDRLRMRRILDVLSTESASLEDEMDGLRRRQERETDTAAFAFEAIENESLPSATPVETFTDAAARYAERIRVLDCQRLILLGMREKVIALIREVDAGRTASAPAQQFAQGTSVERSRP